MKRSIILFVFSLLLVCILCKDKTHNDTCNSIILHVNPYAYATIETKFQFFLVDMKTKDLLYFDIGVSSVRYNLTDAPNHLLFLQWHLWHTEDLPNYQKIVQVHLSKECNSDLTYSIEGDKKVYPINGICNTCTDGILNREFSKTSPRSKTRLVPIDGVTAFYYTKHLTLDLNFLGTRLLRNYTSTQGGLLIRREE
jgi:hypothetical protein